MTALTLIDENLFATGDEDGVVNGRLTLGVDRVLF